jgi:hypothetical protein
MLLRLAGHRYGRPRAGEDDPVSSDRLTRVESRRSLTLAPTGGPGII